jgi:TolB-like protein
MATTTPTRQQDGLSPTQVALVRRHLNEVLASRAFAASKRSQDFLQLIVGHALEGRIDSLRERMIGAEMFGRPVGYDTGNDPVVRVKATEVRKKLAQYYSENGDAQPVRIEFPSGTYVPKFHFGAAEQVSLLQPPSPPVSAEPASPPPAESRLVEEKPHAPAAEKSAISQKRFWPSRSILTGVSIGLALLAIAGYFGFTRWRSDQDKGTGIRSIVVLPFENLSGDPGQDYFAESITEDLIDNLGRISPLRVISRTSALSYKGAQKTLPQIASELSVDGVVEGAVQRDQYQVQVSVRLIDARTDHPIWVHTYVRSVTDNLILQGELAQVIAEQVRLNVAPNAQAPLVRVRSVNSKAENQYMRGMLSIDANDPHGAMNYFQAAIAADPDFAEPHAALAHCWGRAGKSGEMAYKDAFARQKSEALRAIELNDSLAEGHGELAEADMNLDWDWSTAEAEYKRAIALNPSSAPIHESYAGLLQRMGRFPEAIAETQRGMELDPVSARSFWNAATIYYSARQYDKGLPLAEKADALSGSRGEASLIIGEIYTGKGMYAKAIEEFLKLPPTPHVLGHLGNAYALAGQANAARNAITKLQDSVRINGVGGYEIALVYAGLGDRNQALSWLDQSLKAHSFGIEHVKIDPCLDALRSDRRFNDLIRGVGLTP